MVPNSRLKLAQSPCVTPASGSPVAAPGLSRNTASMPACPLPRNSTSPTSNPLEAATRSAISRTRSSSSAMHPITCSPAHPAELLCNEKVGLRPLVCFAECLHNSSQFPNIRGMGDKRQTPEPKLDAREPTEASKQSDPRLSQYAAFNGACQDHLAWDPKSPRRETPPAQA